MLQTPLLAQAHLLRRLALLTQALVRRLARAICHVFGLQARLARPLTTNLVWVLALEPLVARQTHLLVPAPTTNHPAKHKTTLTAVRALGLVRTALVLMNRLAVATQALVAHRTLATAHRTLMVEEMVRLAMPTTLDAPTTAVLGRVLEHRI